MRKATPMTKPAAARVTKAAKADPQRPTAKTGFHQRAEAAAGPDRNSTRRK